jgi:hypothetical protein
MQSEPGSSRDKWDFWDSQGGCIFLIAIALVVLVILGLLLVWIMR